MAARIAIDARFGQNPISGIGRYTSNLLAGIAQQGSPHEFTIFVSEGTKLPPLVCREESFEFISLPGNPHNPLAQRRLGRLLDAHGIDLLHSPDAFAPLSYGGRILLTIHDLIPLVCRKFFYAGMKSRLALLWYLWVKLQCARARAVLTVSRQSAADLCTHMQLPKEKVHVVHNGIGEMSEADPEHRRAIRREYGLKGKTLLYVGRRDPTKNLGFLVRAFAVVHARLEEGVKLVIAGRPDWRYREAERETERCALAESVVHTGHLSESMLSALYAEADVFVFPSLYEGFGLPVLEAMHFGCPVIASDIPVFSEIFGDSAILVNSGSVQKWAAAIESLLKDSTLSREYSNRGLEQAGRMTAKNQAAQTIALYESILNDGS